MKGWKIAYYISTVLLSASMLLGSYFDSTQHPNAVVALEHLGYPAYFATIIGVAKLLGVIGIWQNKVKWLREWAYAGFFFDIIGALVSHLAVGDAFAMMVPAIISLVVVLVSYISFRRLGMGAK